MNIEVEIKAFLSDAEYDRLLAFFQEHAKLLAKDSQQTLYFSGEHDLRAQRSDSGAKLIFKGGKLHDEQRKELEVPIDATAFSTLIELLAALGYPQEIVWLRKRYLFSYKGIEVAIDDTVGYGKIIELEKMSDPKGKDAALLELQALLKELGVMQTAREEFSKRFAKYKATWKELLKDRNLF